MYLPKSQGCLDLIERGSFFKGMTLSWCSRYIVGKYDDFWASLLDNYLGLTPNTRQQLYRWGEKDFVKPIEKANVPFLKQTITTLQLFYFNFPSDPETGDNSYACQLVFNNSHLTFLRTINKKINQLV